MSEYRLLCYGYGFSLLVSLKAFRAILERRKPFDVDHILKQFNLWMLHWKESVRTNVLPTSQSFVFPCIDEVESILTLEFCQTNLFTLLRMYQHCVNDSPLFYSPTTPPTTTTTPLENKKRKRRPPEVVDVVKRALWSQAFSPIFLMALPGVRTRSQDPDGNEIDVGLGVEVDVPTGYDLRVYLMNTLLHFVLTAWEEEEVDPNEDLIMNWDSAGTANSPLPSLQECLYKVFFLSFCLSVGKVSFAFYCIDFFFL